MSKVYVITIEGEGPGVRRTVTREECTGPVNAMPAHEQTDQQQPEQAAGRFLTDAEIEAEMRRLGVPGGAARNTLLLVRNNA